MFLVTCFLYFCSYPNHYYVSLYDARADSKNRLELEGISHVVSLVSFPDVSGGGRGGGGGGGGGGGVCPRAPVAVRKKILMITLAPPLPDVKAF